MERKRLMAFAATLIMTAMGMCGCFMDNNEINDTVNGTETVQEETIILTQRQIEILQAEGLPTNFGDLTLSQKNAITAIEEMLSVTEAKYGISLCYVSYGTDSWGGTEDSLIAFPARGVQELDAFEIMRTKDGRITDTYLHVQAEDLFTAYIQTHAESLLGQGSTRVYGTVTRVTSDEIPASQEEIAGNVDGFWVVFVDGGAVSEEAFAEFAANYASWKQENGFSGSAQLILTRENVLIYLTRFNYTDYLNKDHYLQRVYINS